MDGVSATASGISSQEITTKSMPVEDFGSQSVETANNEFGARLENYFDQITVTGKDFGPKSESVSDPVNAEKQALLKSPWAERNSSMSGDTQANAPDAVSFEKSMEYLKEMYNHSIKVSMGVQLSTVATSSIRQLVRQG